MESAALQRETSPITVQFPRRPTVLRARRRRAPAVLFLAVVLVSATCAPRSRAAGGPIGEQIEHALAVGSASFDHGEWDDLLARGTRDGLVDYALFAADRDQLEGYLARVAAADLGSLSRDHLMALLINAYNAYTIQSILEHPGLASIRDIDGVWSAERHAVGGYMLSLDGIEHNLLRPYFKDPRIHFAVNCASMSCAPLPPWAFRGGELEDQLELWTERFFSDVRNVHVADGTLEVSKLLEWYGDDFVDPSFSPRADTVPSFIAGYAPEPIATFIEEHGGAPPVAFLDYDWALNALTARSLGAGYWRPRRLTPADAAAGLASPAFAARGRAPGGGARPGPPW
jgi:hypothetical protein